MKKLVALSAIALMSVSLSGCETVDSIRSFKLADYVNLPWEHKASSAPVQTAEAVLPGTTLDIPAGLQRDDLRKPFGTDSETAVASRTGL